MMNAIRFHRKGPPEVLQYEMIDRPVPGVGHVLCRVRATGVNYADVMKRAGDSYPIPVELPFIPGAEAVVEIVESGEGVDPGLIGQRAVVFPGASCYADYVVVPTNRVYRLPERLDDEQALALFGQGTTAGIMLRQSTRMAKGDVVLIQAAAGGVGLVAVQLAKAWGAGAVIGCASTPEKRALVKEYGADLVVDYNKPGWTEDVRAFTGGRGVDIVLEMTGGQIAEECFDLMAMFGRSVVFGSVSEQSWLLDTGRLAHRSLSVAGFWTRPHLDNPVLFESMLAEFADLIEEGKLKVHLGGRWPLSQAAKAHAAIESRTATGKQILVPDSVFS
ncbi:zinc-binding dehydrogenase [Sphingobium sp. MK2]|uniref:quinone oxidoreductase family protein n=1 Tax=Sphingobium sp. MK2 TaxID=3116540 RepID=UPI0032E366FA